MKGGFARGCLLGWVISVMPLLAFAEQQAVLSARCFGAAGDNCGVLTGYAQVGFCVGTRCPISGATWEHDECCFEQTVKKRSGKSCVAPAPGMATGSGPAQVCNKEWVKSLQRTAGGWNWWRTVDTSLLNADGKVVWELMPHDIPDINIGIFAGIQRLPNGDTLVCNWNAQDKDGKAGAHLFEVTDDKRVVWQITGADIGQMAQCQVLTEDLAGAR